MTYQILDCPLASKLNDKLYSIVDDNLFCDVNGGARRTDFNLHTKGIDCINDLISWIYNIFPSVCYNFENQYDDGEEGENTLGYDIDKFFLQECWGVVYNKGEGVIMHNHFPFPISFAYYVKFPENSSPFILEGKEISLKEGQLIMFMGHQYHGVFPLENKVDGRCVISGNISYQPSLILAKS
tara:strand:+ start:76 stop:624 length:549 start_codon:yes stop_codon:yes gene_type:complete